MSVFAPQSKDEIQERMKAAYREISNKTVIEGGFARDIINANSAEFEQTYLELNLIYEMAFADTSCNDYLTRKCAEFGVDRKKATPAIGEVTFSGSTRKIIPSGTIVATPNDLQFVTDVDIITDETGTATVGVTCTEPGAAGNVGENLITEIPLSLAGINSVTNLEPTHDGYNEETDAELLERYYFAVRMPATSGNIYHYYKWATSVEGVGVVKILPLWNGNGTVKILLLDANYETASQTLLDKVAAYIEEVRPIGAAVTVATPRIVPIKISVDVKGFLNTEILKSEIKKYAQKRGLSLTYISAAQVTDMIMNQAGVEDCDNVLINGQTRIYFLQDEIPSINEVVTGEYR